MTSRTRIEALRPTGLALALGALGAAVASSLGLPAAALIGSCIAAAAAAAAGVPVAMPVRLRDGAFVVIGISLGAGVEADTLAQARTWALSLAMLAASLVATIAVGTLLLNRGFGLDRETAILSSSPGTMSYAVAIALEGRGDAAAVTTLQLVRLLLIVTTVPLLVGALGLAEAEAQTPAPMRLLPLALLFAAGYGLGTLGGRAGLPAASLLAGMLLTSAAHLLGLAEGAAPAWVVFAGLLVTGTALGTRLRAIGPGTMLALTRAGLTLVLSAAIVSSGFAAATARLTGLPLGEVWIAFAPGGVEAMAAIGLALGYDPAFVALHHFARIVMLLAIVPGVLRLSARLR